MRRLLILLFCIFLLLIYGCQSKAKSSKESGIAVWAREWGTEKNDIGYDVATDISGSIYVAGVTLGSLDGNTSAGAWDIFLTKYDAAGKRLWTKQWGTKGRDEGRGVTADGSGNIYITGYTRGRLEENIYSGKADVFLAKYNPEGKKLWVRQWGTAGDDEGKSVITDSFGNIYVAGYTEGSLDGNTNKGKSDIFLAKYNPEGK